MRIQKIYNDTGKADYVPFSLDISKYQLPLNVFGLYLILCTFLNGQNVSWKTLESYCTNRSELDDILTTLLNLNYVKIDYIEDVVIINVYDYNGLDADVSTEPKKDWKWYFENFPNLSYEAIKKKIDGE